MNQENELSDLVAKAALRNGVQPDVLEALLALESTFANFSVFGSKAEFSRQVARIVDKAAGQVGT